MELVAGGCCGLEVHKKSVVAWLRRVDAAGRLHKEGRTFSPMPAEA